MSTDAVDSPVSPSPQVDNRDGAASRALIVGAVVVVVGLIAAVVAFGSPGSSGRPVLYSVKALLAAAALVASVASFRGYQRRSQRPGFRVAEGSAFDLPPSRTFGYLVVGEVLFTGLVLTSTIEAWANPGGGEVWTAFDSVFAVGMSVLAAVIGAITILMTAFVLSRRSSVRITPEAVGRPGLLRSRTIPWAALRPGSRPRVDGAGRTVTLTIERPEHVVPPLRPGPDGGPRTLTVSLANTSGQPGFLADAIQFYTDHPDRRDAIGTRAEYERLLTDLNRPGAGA